MYIYGGLTDWVLGANLVVRVEVLTAELYLVFWFQPLTTGVRAHTHTRACGRTHTLTHTHTWVSERKTQMSLSVFELWYHFLWTNTLLFTFTCDIICCSDEVFTIERMNKKKKSLPLYHTAASAPVYSLWIF